MSSPKSSELKPEELTPEERLLRGIFGVPDQEIVVEERGNTEVIEATPKSEIAFPANRTLRQGELRKG